MSNYSPGYNYHPRPLKNLNKDERERTPPEFAEYLVGKMRLLFGDGVLAALWVMSDTWYRHIPGIEIWDLQRDATRYMGPWPIIAHPPCGPWGFLRSFSSEDYEHGVIAMEYVHRYGGVVEQPSGSQLFRQYGKPHIKPEVVYQCDFGHRALKRTLLYWYKPIEIMSWGPRPRYRKR